MRELQTGLWHWQAAHPDWTPGQDWDRVVSSYAIDDGDRLLLFDPLAPPSEIGEVAAGRETAIVLTCLWHERDARSLAERLGAPLYVPPPDHGDPNPVEGHVFSAGDRLPVGSSCRSSSCSRRTGRPPTEPASSARSPDARTRPAADSSSKSGTSQPPSPRRALRIDT